MSYLSDYGRDVGNIYQQLGEAQANARLRSGQAWSQALGNIGQAVAAIPGQMKQQKDAEQQRLDAQQGRDMRSLQMQNTQSEMDARQSEATSKAEEEKRRKMVLAIGAGLSNGDPGITKASLDQIAPELRPGVEQYLSDHQKRLTDDIKSRAKLAQALGYPAPVVEVLAAMGGKAMLDEYHKATEGGNNPQAIKAMVDRAAALGDAQQPVKTREIKTLGPDGSETTQIVEDRPGLTFTSAPKPVEAKKYPITVPGPNGQPVQKLVTEDELSKGIPAYRAPNEPQPKFWVMRNGQALRVSDSEYRPGDLPANTREQGRPVTSGDAQDIAGIQEGIKLLGQMNFKPSDTGIAPSIGGAMPDFITNATGFGLGAKQREGMIALVRQIIGKSLEGGVLRKEDEVKYAKILPTLSDPPEVVKTKMENLEKTLTQKLDTRLSAMEDAGYDTAKFRSRDEAAPPQVLAAGPGEHEFANGQIWKVSPDGKSAQRIK